MRIVKAAFLTPNKPGPLTRCRRLLVPEGTLLATVLLYPDLDYGTEGRVVDPAQDLFICRYNSICINRFRNSC